MRLGGSLWRRALAPSVFRSTLRSNPGQKAPVQNENPKKGPLAIEGDVGTGVRGNFDLGGPFQSVREKTPQALFSEGREVLFCADSALPPKVSWT